jgi:hypothetical protein
MQEVSAYGDDGNPADGSATGKEGEQQDGHCRRDRQGGQERNERCDQRGLEHGVQEYTPMQVEETATITKVVEKANRLKAAGSTALMAGDLDTAYEYYNTALETIGECCGQSKSRGGRKEEELQAVAVELKNNATLTLLKMARSMEEVVDGKAAVAFYQEAVESAAVVLEIEPGNALAAQMKEKAMEKVGALGTRKAKRRKAGREVQCLFSPCPGTQDGWQDPPRRHAGPWADVFYEVS